jgi:hypothetical protein
VARMDHYQGDREQDMTRLAEMVTRVVRRAHYQGDRKGRPYHIRRYEMTLEVVSRMVGAILAVALAHFPEHLSYLW